MDFIRPPTDNLYKFIAITGLGLLVLSFILPLREAWNLEREVSRYRAREAAVLDEANLVTFHYERIDSLKTRIDSASDTVIAATLKSWREELESSSATLEERSPRLRTLMERFDSLNVVAAETNVLLKQARRLRTFGGIGAGLGLVLTFLGFGFWYHRVQKHQDAILNAQTQAD